MPSAADDARRRRMGSDHRQVLKKIVGAIGSPTPLCRLLGRAGFTGAAAENVPRLTRGARRPERSNRHLQMKVCRLNADPRLRGRGSMGLADADLGEECRASASQCSPPDCGFW